MHRPETMKGTVAMIGWALIILGTASGCAGDIGGGCAAALDPRTTVEVYDPARGKWGFGVPLPVESMHTRCAEVEGKIYVSLRSGGVPNFLRFDPDLQAWDYLPPAAVGPWESDMVGGGPDLYVLGPQKAVQVFDTLTETWSTGPDMIEDHSMLAAVELGGRIYAIGGSTTAVEVLDPGSGSWQLLAPTPGETYEVAAETDGSLIYVAAWDTPWVYDPAADAWSGGSSPAWGSSDSGMIGRYMYLLGGANLYVLDTATLTWHGRPGRQRVRYYSGVVSCGGYLYAIGGAAPTPCHE